MKQVLWFRRDLRIDDNAILANSTKEVFPIFIFDTNILKNLPSDDKRVTFIYNSVLKLKSSLKSIGLDLAIFHGEPKKIFERIAKDGFDEVLCSVDFDSYAIKRDIEIESILPMRRFIDSFIIDPKEHLKNDGTPYRVFTPFYKSLAPLTQSRNIVEFQFKETMPKLFDYEYNYVPTLSELGFIEQKLERFLYMEPKNLLKKFLSNVGNYKHDRDYWFKDSTSKMSVFLRFGLISPRQIFNLAKKYDNSESFIRELFWREFYNYILYHFPQSETKNFLDISVKWCNNKDDFEKWKNGLTGVPIIDAAMRYLNLTGLMHNRLRMIVASYLTKNLLIDWKWGEQYFALKLLDYEASSNIGSWQWSASTGADAAPYFRIFNPYAQSAKFDPEAIFIKNVISELRDIPAKELHKESNGYGIFNPYPAPIISIKESRDRALNAFKS